MEQEKNEIFKTLLNKFQTKSFSNNSFGFFNNGDIVNSLHKDYIKITNRPAYIYGNLSLPIYTREIEQMCSIYPSITKARRISDGIEYILSRYFFSNTAVIKDNRNYQYTIGGGYIIAVNTTALEQNPIVLACITTEHQYAEYVEKSNYVNPAVLTLNILNSFDHKDTEHSYIRKAFRKMIKNEFVSKGARINYQDDFNFLIKETEKPEEKFTGKYLDINGFNEVNKLRDVANEGFKDLARYYFHKRFSGTPEVKLSH